MQVYRVLNTKTGLWSRDYATRKIAQRAADGIDNAYGAVIAVVTLIKSN